MSLPMTFAQKSERKAKGADREGMREKWKKA